MFKTKIKASFFHFMLSALAVSLIFIAVMYFWFPLLYIDVTNFKEIAIILIAVDLILGPLLTFVVFNPKKKSLRFDLSVIVSVQLIAMSYGLYTIYLTHPVYITYFDNGFNIVTAKQATPEKSKFKNLKVSKFSSSTFTYMEVDDMSRGKLFEEAMNGGRDIEAHAEYYQPYEENISKILSKSLNSKLIMDSHEKTIKEKLNNLSITKDKPISDFAYLPLIGPSKDAIIILDKITAKPVATIITDPWKFAKK